SDSPLNDRPSCTDHRNGLNRPAYPGGLVVTRRRVLGRRAWRAGERSLPSIFHRSGERARSASLPVIGGCCWPEGVTVRRVSVALVARSRARGLRRVLGGQRRVRAAIRLVPEGRRAGPVLRERSAPTVTGP